MNRYDIYDKHRVQAKFYKATMILAITIWVTFLYTFAHAFRVKRRLTASGFGDTTCTSSTLSMPGYVAVPTRGRQSPTSRRSTSGRSTKDQGRTKGPARTNDLYMSKYPPIDPASIYPPLPPQLQYPQLPAPLSPIYSPPIHSSQTHEYFPPPNTYVQPLDQPSSSTVRP
ncbi:hypothetical protein BZA77DRAFT_118460 [Pyronema omphalodes]|nr:hypothetical protein BZA77DRAFT_118460 [Pyronema omphalodes]